MKKRYIHFVVLSILFSLSVSQDTPRLIDIRKILKETLDMMRTVPPPPALVTPIQSLIPGVPPPGSRQPLNVAPDPSPPYYQQQSQPVPLQAPPTQTQQQQQPQLYERQFPIQQQVQSNVYGSQPLQLYSSQVQPAQQAYAPTIPITPPLSRIFAAPTEKDMERLFQLPTDILTKLATDARYIDPADSEPDYAPRKGNGSSSSTNSNLGGFSGFSFSVEDTAKSNKDNVTSTPKPLNATSSVATINSTNSIQKPYYLYKDGPDGRAVPWVLIVPQPNGAPSEFIPYQQVAEIKQMLEVNTEKKTENITVPKTPPVAPAEKASEMVKAQMNASTPTPVSVNTKPAFAFLQESVTESTTTEAHTNEIYLNGKKYKLVADDQTTTKGLAQAQNTTSPPPSTTPLPPISSSSVPLFVSNIESPSTYSDIVKRQDINNNFQLPATKPQQFVFNNQPYIYSPASGSFIPVQPPTPVNPILTPQQQALLSAYRTQQQTPPRLYSLNGQTFVAPQTYSTDSVYQPVDQTTFVSGPNNEYFQQTPIVMRNQDVYSEEAYAQPLHSQPIIVHPSQSAPYLLRSDAIVSTTNYPITTVSSTEREFHSTQNRRYSVEELEEYFRFKNMNFNPNSRILKNETKKSTNVEQSKKSTNKAYKKVKIGMEEKKTTPFIVDTYNMEIYTTKRPKTFSDVRRKDNKKVSKLRMVSEESPSVTVVKMKKPEQKPRPRITAQHCRNIRSFARQFGTLDIESFAKSHCAYIENYYPDLKCSNVKVYVKICKSYYQLRRMYS